MKLKKVMVLLLAILMVLSLAACGGDAGSGGGGKEADGPFSGHDSSEIMNTLVGGKYYMKYKAEVAGFEMEGEMAADGDNTDAAASMLGINIHTLTLDNKSYNIDDTNKIYTVADLEDADEAMEQANMMEEMDYDAMKFSTSGKEEFNGQECSYDEYTFDAEGITSTVRYYMDGKELKGMTVGTGEDQAQLMTMYIEEFSGKIPSGWLELPSGYEEVDEATFSQKVYGF